MLICVDKVSHHEAVRFQGFVDVLDLSATHMQRSRGVEQVLYLQGAALLHMSLTEGSDQLQVVHTVSHRHDVLQTHI